VTGAGAVRALGAVRSTVVGSALSSTEGVEAASEVAGITDLRDITTVGEFIESSDGVATEATNRCGVGTTDSSNGFGVSGVEATNVGSGLASEVTDDASGATSSSSSSGSSGS